MYTIIFTDNFKKQYSKLIKKDKKLVKPIDKVVTIFDRDPFYPGLKTHIVDYDKYLGNIYSSRITGDVRILWGLDPTQSLVLVLLKIGGHDFVY